jgi:Ca2+-binding EF-hand superfamily protein
MFKKYDTTNDGFLDLQELKYMMEKLGHAQTHVGLKQMIKEVGKEGYDLC